MPEETTIAAEADRSARASRWPPLARSAISPAPPVAVVAGWEVSRRRSSAPLRLADLSALAKIGVRTPAGSPLAQVLGVTFGQARRQALAEGIPSRPLVVGSGPDEWLVLSPVGTQAELVSSLEAVTQEQPRRVIDLTHGRALGRLSGPHAAAALAKLCPIDLSEEATPNGRAFRSLVANLVTDVVRDDLGEVCSYLLHAERSSGRYLFDCILDAGAEFGIEVDGFPDKEI